MGINMRKLKDLISNFDPNPGNLAGIAMFGVFGLLIFAISPWAFLAIVGLGVTVYITQNHEDLK